MAAGSWMQQESETAGSHLSRPGNRDMDAGSHLDVSVYPVQSKTPPWTMFPTSPDS